MARDYDGQPVPAGTLGKPEEATPGAGHTNAAGGLGQRRSNNSLSRHFASPVGLNSSVISLNFWTTFILQTKASYDQAPDLYSVDMKHPMHPNTALPGSRIDEDGNMVYDDLNAVSPGDTASKSKALPANTNWPFVGPTARQVGPAGAQNPKFVSINTNRINYQFMEARKDRYKED